MEGTIVKYDGWDDFKERVQVLLVKFFRHWSLKSLCISLLCIVKGKQKKKTKKHAYHLVKLRNPM